LSHRCLDIFNEVVEPFVQIVGQLLDILPGRRLAILILEQPAEFENPSDVVAFVFVQ
jgi:hypothetical protein